MKKIVIYAFGNPLLRKDSLPLKLIPRLRKEFPSMDFKEIDPSEDLHTLGKKINIIDTVVGIDRAKLIKDIDSLRTEKSYSLHDFDLAHNLKLLKKMNIINEVNIFGIPDKISEKEAFKQLKKLISDWLS